MASYYATEYTQTLDPTNRLAGIGYHGANLVTYSDQITLVDAVTNNDTIDFFEIPAGLTFLWGKLWCSAGTPSSGSTIKIGAFGLDGASTYDGSTSNDDDFFSTAINTEAAGAKDFAAPTPAAANILFRTARGLLVRGTLSNHNPPANQIIAVTMVFAK